jgi:predicted RNA-binding protein with RPS1 domain
MTMMEEEVSFPRGGGGRRRSEPTPVDQESDKKKNRKKRKSTEDDAPPATPQSIKADLLFGSKSKKSDSEKSSKKRKKSEVAVDTGKHSLLPLGGGGVVISTKKHKKDKSAGSTVVSTPIIEALNFSKLAKGTKLLACVREVQDTFAIVSLPNLLTAYMLPQPEYPLHRTLAVGQTLAVVVQKVVLETVAGGGGQTQRRIQVTAVPQAVNPRSLLMGDESSKNTQENTMASAANRLARASVPVRGQILSIEDHGCVVDLGFGARGFVRFEKIQDGENFVILEDDEDEAKEEGENIENEDDKAPPTVLQKGRLYDFLVLPVASKDLSATVFPLSLPPVSKLADKAVSELSMTSPSKENRQKTKEVGTPMTLASLTPGWLVQVKVEALATNGLCVSFLGNIFRGAMEMNHLGATLVPDSKNGAAASGPEGGWKHLASSLFHKHQHFCARILAVDVPTKLVRLSIAPQVLKMDRIADFTSALSGFPSEGTVVPDCTVVRLDPGIGALLALPTQYNYAGDVDELLPKSLTDSNEVFSNPSFQEACHVRKVYVHISKAMDETDEKSSSADGRFNKEFAPATKHSVRILNTTHWIEGIAAGGCAPSILEAKVLSHEDLVAGTVYKQVPVCAQMPGGSAMVQLGGTSQKRKGKKKISSNSITGILPPIQLFDTSSSGNSEYRQRIFQTKFAVDAKVDVRVLWVDPIRKRCLVTAKKTIVQAAPESIITSYAGLDVGQTAVGYISRIDDRGLYVTFCNKVYGRVTARSLATELGIENHRENYKVGDAVTCRVVKLQKTEKKRQRASVVDNDSEDENENENSSQSPSGQVFWDLTLSLRTRAVQGEETSDMVEDDIDICHPTPVALKVGVILPAKSMKIVDIVDGKLNKHGKFSHGYAVVSIKSKYLSDEESQETGKMTETLECKLPFDQLMDSFESSDIETVESMNCLARRSLVIGKKINQKGLVLLDPKKSNVDYATGVGKMPVVSIRREVIRVKEEQDKTSDSRNIPLLPSPVSDISVGSLLIGYVAETNPRFGGFIRFLDGMTGLITKKQKGHLLSLYSTVRVRVKAIDDTVEPKRILLSLDTEERPKHSITHDHAFEVGDKVEKAIVLDVNFYEISLEVPDLDLKETSIVVHCTTKDSNVLIPRHRKKPLKVSETLEITKSHPFYGIKIGQELTGFTVVSVHKRKQGIQVILTDRGECFETTASEELSSMIAKNLSDIHPGSKTRAVVVGYARGNKGLIVQVSPSVRGFIPGLELARDLDVLNGLQENIPRGAVLECVVLDEENFFKNRLRCPLPSFYKKKLQTGLKKEKTRRHSLMLSVLGRDSEPSPLGRPRKGELVIGMINSHIPQIHAPSLMLETRGGHVVRADITELEEPDEWRNMPLRSNTGNKAQNDKSTEDDDDSQADSEASKNNEDDLHER